MEDEKEVSILKNLGEPKFWEFIKLFFFGTFFFLTIFNDDAGTESD